MSEYHFPKKTIRDVPLYHKTVLLRADFNVPLTEAGEIRSDYRITQTLPTIQYLIERGCRLVIISHLGRPNGKPYQKYSLKPVAKRLQELLPAVEITLTDNCIGDKPRQACKRMKPGTIVLLENLRFHPEEEANDRGFAKNLKTVSGADYFVQDGFGVVHRAHASTAAITEFLPSVAGLLLEREVTMLQTVMEKPQKPVVAVVGGAKISDKIEFIDRLLTIADTVSNDFSVAIIPHTFENTSLNILKSGNFVNLEVDILAKYVEKILSTGDNKVLDENFLKENGFF